jgi:hypothetical protein
MLRYIFATHTNFTSMIKKKVSYINNNDDRGRIYNPAIPNTLTQTLVKKFGILGV